MEIPDQMQIIVASKRGDVDNLSLETCPVPLPQPGEVLIRVESASVNFSDVKRRRGDLYPFATIFPFTPGGEVAGHIAALGDGVDGLVVGAPVFALVGGDGKNGYAQYAKAYAPQVAPIPPGISFDVASAIMVAGTTALLVLKQSARLQAGESVLIPAASGAVGQYAIQIAKALGAGTVIAATSGAEKAAQAKKLGADAVINYNTPGWVDEVKRITNHRGADIVLDSAGGLLTGQSLSALASFGRMVIFGSASGRSGYLSEAAFDAFAYEPAPNQSIVCFNIGGWFMGRPEAAGAAVGELTGMQLSGKVAAPTITTMPLSAAAEAHRLLESRRTIGKLILKPWLT